MNGTSTWASTWASTWFGPARGRLVRELVCPLACLVVMTMACSTESAPRQSIRVAAASSLRDAFESMAAEFTRASGVEVVLVFGASGKLAHQVENGAPFDVYAAADVSYVDRLTAGGHALAASRSLFARGVLVLYSAGGSAPDMARLEGADILRIGLANPEHAPYGRAARQALERSGLWPALESKLVYSASVGQAMQYARTGNVEVSFVALAQVHGRGSHRRVPPELYDPLEQAMAVVADSRHKAEALEFIEFALSGRGQEVLASYGYGRAATGATPAPASAPTPVFVAAPTRTERHGLEWYPLMLSFKVALIATLLSLLLGVGLAALLSGRRFFGRELLDALVTTPLVLPPTVLGYYVLVTLGQQSPIGQWYERIVGSPIVFTVSGAIVAATIGALPLVVKSARAALEAVDPALVGAARTLGANRTRAFFTVSLPLAGPGIIAGLMLAFAKSLGDFGVTLMVAGDIPGRTQTAALYIYDAIQADREAQAAGMIAVLSAVAIAALYAVNKLTRGTRAW